MAGWEDEARLPAGSSGGGEWTASGGGEWTASGGGSGGGSGTTAGGRRDRLAARASGIGAPGPRLNPAHATELHRAVHADGGFTVDPRTGEHQSKGFAVSIYPERSQVHAVDRLRPHDIERYVARNSDSLKHQDHFVGAWHDTKSGKVWLDVAVIKHNKADAISLAKRFNQKAIFDLEAMQEIDTGGTGTPVPRTPLKPSKPHPQ